MQYSHRWRHPAWGAVITRSYEISVSGYIPPCQLSRINLAWIASITGLAEDWLTESEMELRGKRVRIYGTSDDYEIKLPADETNDKNTYIIRDMKMLSASFINR